MIFLLVHRIWRLEHRNWRTTSFGDRMQTLWKQKIQNRLQSPWTRHLHFELEICWWSFARYIPEMGPQMWKVKWHFPHCFFKSCFNTSSICLTGSPFLLQVEGEPSGRLRETVSKTMEQAEPVKKNQHCEFYLQIPGYCKTFYK